MEPLSLALMAAAAGKVVDHLLGDGANKLVATIVGGVLGNHADRVVQGAISSSRRFFENLRTQDPSLNHDLERATREAYLLATLELVRQAELRTELGSSRLLTAGDDESLREGPKVLAPAEHRVGELVTSDIDFTDLDGKTGTFADFRGKPATVICMTGVGCPIARKYAPVLVAEG